MLISRVYKCLIFKALSTFINPESLGIFQAFAGSTTINNKMGPSYKTYNKSYSHYSWPYTWVTWGCIRVIIPYKWSYFILLITIGSGPTLKGFCCAKSDDQEVIRRPWPWGCKNRSSQGMTRRLGFVRGWNHPTFTLTLHPKWGLTKEPLLDQESLGFVFFVTIKPPFGRTFFWNFFPFASNQANPRW